MMGADNPDLKDDILNIIFLTFLYVLQTIPIGLSSALPLILQSRNVSYADQVRSIFTIRTQMSMLNLTK